MNRARRILITGASGYLGHAVLAAAPGGSECALAGRRGADVVLDLDVPGSAARAVATVAPDAVLHLAAMSRMGDCAADPAAAERANATTTAALAAATRERGAMLVMVSTDLVFAGDEAPYRADDAPEPISVYGASKRDGERATVDAGGLVVRVPLLFGPSFDGRRGATDMVRAAAREGRTLRLFTDEFRTPLHVADAAAALWELVAERPGSGVMHLAGPERVSRHELGVRFAAIAGLDEVVLEAASNTDPTRPRDVSLVSDRSAARSLDAMLADS